MAPIPLCFVVSKPTTLSKADQQRRRSKALSHAAVVAFTRRASGSSNWINITATKGKEKPANKSKTNLHRGRSRPREPSNPSNPTGQPRTDKAASVTSGLSHASEPLDAPTLCYALYEDLDPFLRPAISLTRRERNILHHYLLTTPTYVYGTQPGTFYCPVRDVNVPQIQINRLWLQWTLLYAEKFVVPDDSQKTVTLLARRAKIYSYINELIVDPLACVSDATIAGLAFGSLIEWQVGSLELARRHLGFVRHTLLPKRSGPRALSFHYGFCIYTNLLAVGLGTQAFVSSHTMRKAVRKFVRITSAMQQHSTEILEGDLRHSRSITARQNSKPWVDSQQYRVKRRQVFGHSSTLHGFLVPLDPEDAIYSSHQLVLLWVLNKMLLELRDDVELSVGFLDTLCRYVESHDDPSPFGSGGPRQKRRVMGSGLKSFTLTSMIGYISYSYLPSTTFKSVDWSSESSTQQERPLLRFWENIDMFELLRLLSKQSKYKVAQQLSAWLIGPPPGKILRALGEDELEALGEEMTRAWLEQASGACSSLSSSSGH
ncbi:hypothetical protein H2200_006446 [Cladophialophora chaetospira]|uniref:Uncharacterized protein n=1 Tax=Cladophialophora chaetospira TaxID=386627 RepID=A0AA38X8E3_9EURO|nr:hypothetical protein H2200_006446 [Cladophialophora chaetospira]